MRVGLRPVTLAAVSVGVVVPVVNVKDRAAEDPTFPAASVWLTVTDLLPSPVVRVQLENE